jgi:tRNA-dihydrouridine synthase
MSKNHQELYDKLRKGIFLSSMMEITDGSYCSTRKKGCTMVQLGAYLAEPPAYGEHPYFLPPTRKKCIQFLRQECEKAKNNSNIVICLNLATPKLEWGLEAAKCFYNAGGDLIELNIHGSYEPYLQLGKLRAMVYPEHREELFNWIESFTKLDIPLIMKFREGVIQDYSPVLDHISNYDLFGIHFNVRNEEKLQPTYDFVLRVKRKYSFFLLVSGYVRSANDVQRLFENGADMVGIAEPTIKDQKYIYKIAKTLK